MQAEIEIQKTIGSNQQFEEMLSDATKVAGNEWRVVKEWAMTEDYDQCEYYGTLGNDERKLLEALRIAQRI